MCAVWRPLEYISEERSTMDRHSRDVRSRVMSKIVRENTGPERLLRRALTARGVRYRLHGRLPGRPDIVFNRSKLAVFVDGCFWHSCKKCNIPRPRSNKTYWLPKLARNQQRDRRVNMQLVRRGWSVVRLWEHQVFSDAEECAAKVLHRLLGRLPS